MCSRRFLAALAAALLALVYSGCGDDKKESAGSSTPAKADEKAAVSPSGAQMAPAGNGEMIDVSLVSPDDFAAVVIYPRRIAQSLPVAEVLKEETIAASIKKFGIDPGEVQQIIVLFSMGEEQPGNPEPTPIIITRFTHDVDAKEVLTKLQAASALPEPAAVKETEVGGKRCFAVGPTNDRLAYAPNTSTIVMTTREKMGRVVSAAQPRGPLLERLKKAEAGNDILVAVEPGAIPNLDTIIDAAKKGSKGSPVDMDVVKTLQGATASFSLTAPSLLRVVVDAKDADASGKVEKSLQQVWTRAAAGLTMARLGIPKEMKAAYAPLVLCHSLILG
jgi:hypothetical protein